MYEGDRQALRPLFRLAEDSEQQIDSYLHDGEVFVADDGQYSVGYLQLVPSEEPGVFELKSMAVLDDRQRAGVGSALVHACLEQCRERGATRLMVATATADTGNLRFYQLQGFRLLRVERDAFGPDTGYAGGIVIDGIPLRDRIWLDQEFPEDHDMRSHSE